PRRGGGASDLSAVDEEVDGVARQRSLDSRLDPRVARGKVRGGRRNDSERRLVVLCRLLGRGDRGSAEQDGGGPGRGDPPHGFDSAPSIPSSRVIRPARTPSSRIRSRSSRENRDAARTVAGQSYGYAIRSFVSVASSAAGRTSGIRAAGR